EVFSGLGPGLGRGSEQGIARVEHDPRGAGVAHAPAVEIHALAVARGGAEDAADEVGVGAPKVEDQMAGGAIEGVTGGRVEAGYRLAGFGDVHPLVGGEKVTQGGSH